MINMGTVRPGSTIYVPFDTFAGATGASITMSGLAVGDILIYKNGGTTARASTTGFTLLDTDGIDFASLTGIHGFSIDLSSNATADFYTAGARYFVVVSTITVDTQTVSFVAATFEIGYPGAILDTTIATLSTQTSFTLTVGPAEDNALNGCTVIIHDIASAVQWGKAIVSGYTGSTKTVTLVAGVTFTAAAGDNISIFPPAQQPTTWGRTVDVSTGGEVGLDWANVGSPTTTVGLTNTTVGIVTAATTVTNLTNERGKYSNGAVWIGPSANTNTVSYTDGIITNPVSTIAAAKTIADALLLRKFYTIRTGTVQIGADMTGYDFDGTAWSLTTTGGSRDVSSSSFNDAKVIGGTYASTTAESHWNNCEFSTGVSVAAVHMTGCTFAGTLTLNAAGDYDFIDCASVVAGTGTPIFAVPAGTVNISFRRWSGGISITGITAGSTISIDMVSGGTVTLAGADGNVQVRGMTAGITDNRTGTPTLGQNAAINITKINTEVDTALADINLDHLVGTATGIPAVPAGTYLDQIMDDGTATYDRTTDSLQAIRDRGDVAWITATGFSTLDAAGVRTAIGLGAANLDTQLGDLPTNAELTTALGTADDATLAAIAALNNLSAAQVNAEVVDVLRTDTLPDSYAADAAQPTFAQAVLEILQFLTEKAVAGTTVTVRKPDGTTSAMTFTLDDGASPTSITRAT